jgi:acetolactate synthase-1/2/3 large subunit
MKASDLFVRCLEEEGVEYIFGVPGEENADIMMSLLDSKIRFVVCRHEQGAAFMADLCGRLTGKPGVCLGTLGPGATNLVTGVANAHFDRSPLLAITGQGATTRLHKESHQNMDVVGMFQPITKWAASIRRADNIPEVVRKAIRLAQLEKPGATHIELPEDIAKEPTEQTPIPVAGRQLRRAAPDHKALARAVDILRAAKRPLVLAGNGCVRKRASTQLQRLVDATGISVVHTFMGKGVISDRDPHSLFVAGLGSKDHITTAFGRADVVVAIGYDLIEWHPDRWNPNQDKTIIHIDFEPAEVDNHYRTNVEIVCDIAAALWELNERLGSSVRFDVPEFTQVREHMMYELGWDAPVPPRQGVEADGAREAREAATSDVCPMKPQRILRDLRSFMADDDILISDVGAHKMWVARCYPAFAPNSVVISNGFCSMGIAVPGAISAKMVRPERTVVGLCGDGGFMMNLQELATAVQYGVPAIFMVWEDGAYGLIAWKQEVQYGRTSHTDFVNPDLVALSRAFGASATRIERADALGAALLEARAETKRPSVIIVPVDYSENVKLTRRLGQLVAH